MSDRTWNAVDSRLYEEDWSQGAILVAGCLLTRCPNAYGVFDMPWGFLNLFFKGLYVRHEINSIIVELEGYGFIKLFNDKKTIWIVSKWKRSGNPSRLHWIGVDNHLKGFPESKKDFLSYYEDYYTRIETPLNGDTRGIESQGVPPANPDSESDTDPEKEKKDPPPFFTSKELEYVLGVDPTSEVVKLLGPFKSKQIELNQMQSLDLIFRKDGSHIEPGMSQKTWSKQVWKCLQWAKGDSFWGDNFMSITPLRQVKRGNKDGITKLEKMYRQWLGRNGKPKKQQDPEKLKARIDKLEARLMEEDPNEEWSPDWSTLKNMKRDYARLAK